jgi:hypothetical protein
MSVASENDFYKRFKFFINLHNTDICKYRYTSMYDFWIVHSDYAVSPQDGYLYTYILIKNIINKKTNIIPTTYKFKPQISIERINI